ncbi:MAG: zinc-dependent alcohol dehydrogenase family protein [candidate division KSB1 bacterium]|nr:zinc-dependent alcohol dehydrogenase family protein [candidate division KSB1 bacterium]MDZ7334605.1 zinc-dependent alcohol dehydrogenase family protein [candidate division KSB1 bacterium]MDZ7356587.1 zinc-dependent alcohol dehydrogenase family protein [candidate division KSB1 bacterium]MDZ7399904.1 zinc-dependent alcohol dehydrogenase family protein [candidate division KSB1 bacterium]
MKAMILTGIVDLTANKTPLDLQELPRPIPKENEILIKVLACGVCHTELDEIEGRTPPSFFPMVLGHQVVGRVVEIGKSVTKHRIEDRVGVAWIFSSCGRCEFCLSGRENLCPDFKATGRDAFGGYAEFMTVGEDFAYPIPEVFSDAEAAPLLCAGAIGYRSLRLTNLKDGQYLGLTGFGASGHLVLLMVKYLYSNVRIFVFARSEQEQKFARELGADWAGDTDAEPPHPCHSIIDTTPVWKPIVAAMERLQPGGRLVINAIRKETNDQHELLQLDYPRHLWMEKEIKSVANITRRDVLDFLKLAAEIPIKPEIQCYSLDQANQALLELKQRKIRGAKVLTI